MKVKLAAAGAAALLLVGGCLVALVVVLMGPGKALGADMAPAADVCQVTLPDGVDLPKLTSEQAGNAKVIIATGAALHVPPRGLVVGIATAMQESRLINVNYGDRDSLGLFQQRPSQGWGTPEQVRDPVHASTEFFTRLLKVDGWQDMPVWQAAQRVQRSAFPTAYAKWTPLAESVVAAATGGQLDLSCDSSGGAVAGDWTVPVAHGTYVLTAGFDDAGGMWSSGHHTGLDFAAPIGTPVVAAASGKVTYVGEGGAYGHNLVKIDNGGGIETWYAHMSAAHVSVGDQVKAGGLIGEVGAQGNVTGPHLHLEVRVKGTPVDPDAWLRKHGVTP